MPGRQRRPGGGSQPPKPLVHGGGGDDGGAEVRQVEEGVGAVEPALSLVVGERGLLGSGEGAEPEAGALVGLSDLGHPLAPRPLAHARVLARRGLRAALPPRRIRDRRGGYRGRSRASGAASEARVDGWQGGIADKRC
jgi:hypothetical protein